MKLKLQLRQHSWEGKVYTTYFVINQNMTPVQRYIAAAVERLKGNLHVHAKSASAEDVLNYVSNNNKWTHVNSSDSWFTGGHWYKESFVNKETGLLIMIVKTKTKRRTSMCVNFRDIRQGDSINGENL